MDLHQVAQEAFQVVATASLPVALALLGWAMRQAQARWHFTMSEKVQAAAGADITAAVNMGIGWGRARLASGEMSLDHVSFGNVFVDQLATAAMTMLSKNIQDSGITTDDIAHRIVAGIGHALGDDPSVPSVKVLPAVGTATDVSALGVTVTAQPGASAANAAALSGALSTVASAPALSAVA